jgi:hypothetical protein
MARWLALHTAPIEEKLDTAALRWAGGLGTAAAVGTWQSGDSMKLQFSPDGDTWIDAKSDNETAIVFTADGMFNFVLGPCFLRISVTAFAASGSSVQVGILEGR